MHSSATQARLPGRGSHGSAGHVAGLVVLAWALMLAAPPAWSQEEGATEAEIAALARALEGESSWLTLELGRVALERGDPGAALSAFLKAREEAGRDVFPEADLAIGDFWRGEGELDQAERSYERALDDLRIAENLIGYREYDYGRLRFVLLERLADLDRLRENYGAMEERYSAIVQSDEDFSSGTLADRLRRNYDEGGLNRVLTLYRLESGFAVRAHAELGWLYYRTGRYEKAVVHSLLAVTNVLSAALLELRRADAQYAFSSLEVTLRDAYRRANVKAYLEEAGIWRMLYYLAAEAYALSHQPRAREIWEVLQRSSEAGMYQGLAARQLARPWVEAPLKESYQGAAGR